MSTEDIAPFEPMPVTQFCSLRKQFGISEWADRQAGLRWRAAWLRKRTGSGRSSPDRGGRAEAGCWADRCLLQEDVKRRSDAAHAG